MEVGMSPYALIASGKVILFPFLVGFAAAAGAATESRVGQTYVQLPLHFEANQGQVHKDVRFLSRGPGYNLFLTAGEAVLVLSPPNPDAREEQRGAQARPEARAQTKSTALRISLVGAARKPLVSGLEELPGKSNYFIGNDPAKWRTNVPTYGVVRYREVYPGIDLVYHGNQRQLEYDFVVAPGADPDKIELDFKGADKMEIDAQGDLVLHAGGSTMRQHKPFLYQEADGRRQEVAGRYVPRGVHRFGFEVAEYDRSRPLVIDPVLSYSTYLGGTSSDAGNGVAVDILGNAYVTGFTFSVDFPTTAGAFQAPGGFIDVFVTKINPSGSALVYSTFFGGSETDIANGIDIDVFGNAYVSGRTESTNFPVTAGAFQPVHAGGPPDPQTGTPPPEGFVTKLDSSGSVLVYSTYLGGSGSDEGRAIAVDLRGNAHVAGRTGSSNFPTANAVQAVFGGGGFDTFVTKLDPTGSSLVYSTYLGGGGLDEGHGVAVDFRGNAYITGFTRSVNFPTANAFQENLTGNLNAFVTKLDPGGALFYSTYLGGGNDFGLAIAVDLLGNAYVTGGSLSPNFPTTAGAFQTVFGGTEDAFVTKLDHTGSALVYSTYLGGNLNDEGHGVAVDLVGNAYLTGRTSGNFPTADAVQGVFGGGVFDAFVTKLNPDGSALVYSTYLGGGGLDLGQGIAVHPLGTAYVTGLTSSTNFPTANALQSTLRGGQDAFVAKIRPSPRSN
jgi:beta-propeller repeat-containing protein